MCTLDADRSTLPFARFLSLSSCPETVFLKRLICLKVYCQCNRLMHVLDHQIMLNATARKGKGTVQYSRWTKATHYITPAHVSVSDSRNIYHAAPSQCCSNTSHNSISFLYSSDGSSSVTAHSNLQRLIRHRHGEDTIKICERSK